MNFASLTPEQQQQVIQQGAQRYRSAPTAEQLTQNAALAAQLMQAAGLMPTTDADLVRQGIDWLDASGMPASAQQPAPQQQAPMPPKRPANMQGANNEQAPSPPRRPDDLQQGNANPTQQVPATDSPEKGKKTTPPSDNGGTAASGKQPPTAKTPVDNISRSAQDAYDEAVAAYDPMQGAPPQPLVVDVTPRRPKVSADDVVENPRTPLAPINESWGQSVARGIRDMQSKVRMNPNNPARAIKGQLPKRES
jgi:hypothetical protein